MTFYDDMQSVASEILGEFNQGSMQYVKLTPGNGPKDNPGPSTRQPFAIKGTANGVAFKYVASGQAIATDKQVIAAVDNRYVPSILDLITINGVDHKITSVEQKPASGTPVAYLFVVRRGTM